MIIFLLCRFLTNMNTNIVTKEQFNEFIIHQLKGCEIREETCYLMNLDQLGPEYYFRSSDIDICLLLQCGLCRQAANDPFACNVCYVQYCRRCLVTMINARSIEEWEAKVEMTASPLDHSFYCVNNCRDAKTIFYLAEDIKNINEKMFKCPIKNCKKMDRWTRMANHVLKCKAKSKYIVNIAKWGCEFMMKFEKPYEIMKRWEDFVQSEFEKEIIAANITFAEPQSTALKVDKTIKKKKKHHNNHLDSTSVKAIFISLTQRPKEKKKFMQLEDYNTNPNHIARKRLKSRHPSRSLK